MIILFMGVLLFASHFFAWLFSFTKVPDVLLLMLIGVVLGPVTNIITPEFFGEVGALFAVVVLTIMLFESGTELRWDVLVQSWRGTALLSVVNFMVTTLVVAGILWSVTDLPLLVAFMVAAIVGEISAAVVIPLIDHLRMDSGPRAVLVLEAAMTDVLPIVITIALLTAYHSGIFAPGQVVRSVLFSFLGAGVIGVLGALLWSVLLTHVRHMQNSIFTTPAYVFILFGLAEYWGWSGPIAALTFGIMMGNIPFLKIYLQQHSAWWDKILNPVGLSERERSFMSEVVFLLETLFFVYVGISLTIGGIQSAVIGVSLVVLMFVVRAGVVRFTVDKSWPQRDRVLMAVLAPKGLAAAVLATLISQQIAEGQLVAEIVYVVILGSVVVTSILVFFVSKTGLQGVYGRLVGPTVVAVSDDGERSPNLADL